jgi:hypothetical protein
MKKANTLFAAVPGLRKNMILIKKNGALLDGVILTWGFAVCVTGIRSEK